jgi:zinc protease
MRTRHPLIAASLPVLLAGVLLASASCRGSSPSQVSAPGPGAAGAAAGAKALSEAPLPLAPDVVRGELPSGLTYYVRPNRKPVKRATLWLVVNAGSVLEDDDQRGLAHYLEHMAFNGTKRFAKQEIVDYLERIGMRFGPDVNAFTSFDETVYQLEVPTDDPEALGRAVDILHEWAQGVALEPEEVDKERGVVLEERRLGRGAQGRLLDQVIPAALPGSRYGVRLPIGTAEVLEKATAAEMRRFYQDWYRPDLMAVVAVGDFEPAAMEKMIRERFGDLAAPESPRPRPDPEVPAHDHTVALTVSDPELPITVVGIVAKRPRRVLTSARDYRRSVIDELFSAMLNQRLDELSRSPDAPFVGAAVGRQTIVRAIDVWFQGAVVKGAAVTGALEALAAEVERVARFGFTATEIERAKKEIQRRYQQQAREADTTPSAQHAAEIQRHFLQGEAMPGIAAELALVEQILPGIGPEDFGAVAREVAAEDSRIIIAAGNSGTSLPGKAELLAAASAGRARAAAAYVDEAVSGPLLAREPAPGTIRSERSIPELGVTEWTLENGMTVVLKPTRFKNDELVASLRSPGGHSLASDADHPSARVAAEIAAATGYGSHSAVQLYRRLAGTSVSLSVEFRELASPPPSRGATRRRSPPGRRR